LFSIPILASSASGLASQTELYTGWNYIGGLWEKNILSQLFWFHDAKSPRVPGKRSSKYRAPTWSWASIDGRIAWYHPSLEYKWLATINIVSVHVELKDTSHPFSEVIGGELRVRGSLQTTYRVKKRTESETDPNNLRMAGTQFQFPSGGDLTIYQDTACPCENPCESCKGGLAFILLGEYEKVAEPPLKRHVHSQIGLVLTPVEGDRYYFRRIGWFLEHLRLKTSSFPDHSVMREVTIF
jgi:hypothetical protein